MYEAGVGVINMYIYISSSQFETDGEVNLRDNFLGSFVFVEFRMRKDMEI